MRASPPTGFRISAALLAAPVLLIAAEGEGAPVAAEAPSARWTNHGKIGAYGSSVLTSNADTSRDTSISGATETFSYRLQGEAGLDFKDGKHTLEQDLSGKFGRKKDEDRPWIENTDEIRYDGVYRYEFLKPHFGFGSWGWESVFTGPEPEEDAFTPGLLKVATGYGQLHENFWDKAAKFEGRVGVAGRQRYGKDLSDEEKEFEIGLELFLRIEHTLDDRLTWHAQYEAFSEFEDPGHLTNLLTAGLSVQLAKYLTAELGLRAYLETRPEDVDEVEDDGYDELSVRQDTLLGLTYSW